jgi:xanthine dehydrogenase accessory factor
VGTQFLILDDGSYVGTIGGGLLEAQVLEEAKHIFDTKSAKRVSYHLTGIDVAETDMLCGGDVEVFFEPVPPGNPNHLYIFQKMVDIIRKGGSGMMVTLIRDDLWETGEIHKMFLESDGEEMGALPGDEELLEMIKGKMAETIGGGKPGILTWHDKKGDDMELFLEPVISEPILYVFGAGHVSSEIVPLMSRIGFKVVVIDDRPEFADPDRFPEAEEVHLYPFGGVMDRVTVGPFSYIIIVTRGHIHDKTVLSQALRTDAKYIGMIGSRRKRDMIYGKLMEEGFTRKDIDRVYSPIGLKIGAETPAEIAVSIAAELIMIRAGIKEA